MKTYTYEIIMICYYQIPVSMIVIMLVNSVREPIDATG